MSTITTSDKADFLKGSPARNGIEAQFRAAGVDPDAVVRVVSEMGAVGVLWEVGLRQESMVLSVVLCKFADEMQPSYVIEMCLCRFDPNDGQLVNGVARAVTHILGIPFLVMTNETEHTVFLRVFGEADAITASEMTDLLKQSYATAQLAKRLLNDAIPGLQPYLPEGSEKDRMPGVSDPA